MGPSRPHDPRSPESGSVPPSDAARAPGDRLDLGAGSGPTRLLIVEDNADSRRSLQRLFQFHGFVVSTAPDATTALALLAAGPPPHAVLTDLLLPDTDGHVVLEAAADLVPRPYLGLITGWNPADEDPRLQAVGLDGLFLKPLDVTAIVAAIRKHPAGALPGG